MLSLLESDPRSKKWARATYVRQQWKAGQSMVEIGRDLNITRERVGQILGRAKNLQRGPDEVRAIEAEQEFDLPLHILGRWLKAGLIKKGPHQFLSRKQIVGVIARLKARPCWKCGRPIERLDLNAVACPKHRALKKGYLAWTKEHQRKHKRLTQEWSATHRDKQVMIQRRSKRVYYLVHMNGMPRAEARAVAAREFPYPWKGES